MVVGARQIFHLFGQNNWFLENNRALSKLLFEILHYLISITRLEKKQSIKSNFILNTRANLEVAK